MEEPEDKQEERIPLEQLGKLAKATEMVQKALRSKKPNEVVEVKVACFQSSI